MCGGRRPSPPQVVYQGPSQEDIDRHNAAMEAYRQQAAEQHRQLVAQLQKQIDDANAAMFNQQAQLAEERATAARQAASMQQGSYAVQTTQATPAATQTTAATKEKANPRTRLKIAPGATPAAAGAGLNIGV